jgi:hypothetical protein
MKYLEAHMPNFNSEWPISDWALRAATVLLAPLPTVNYTRVEMPRASGARRKVQFTVVVTRSVYPLVKYHKFYTYQKHRIASRLWIMRKNLCGYVECDEIL